MHIFKKISTTKHVFQCQEPQCKIIRLQYILHVSLQHIHFKVSFIVDHFKLVKQLAKHANHNVRYQLAIEILN